MGSAHESVRFFVFCSVGGAGPLACEDVASDGGCAKAGSNGAFLDME